MQRWIESSPQSSDDDSRRVLLRAIDGILNGRRVASWRHGPSYNLGVTCIQNSRSALASRSLLTRSEAHARFHRLHRWFHSRQASARSRSPNGGRHQPRSQWNHWSNGSVAQVKSIDLGELVPQLRKTSNFLSRICIPSKNRLETEIFRWTVIKHTFFWLPSFSILDPNLQGPLQMAVMSVGLAKHGT